MARRANLAAGILGRPQLLMLDEPTRGHRRTNPGRLLEAVRLQRDRGASVVMVNHDANEMAAVCDRLITLRDGGVGEGMASRVT
jgi:energy-coupling factor transport system ATP-binding protein